MTRFDWRKWRPVWFTIPVEAPSGRIVWWSGVRLPFFVRVAFGILYTKDN